MKGATGSDVTGKLTLTGLALGGVFAGLALAKLFRASRSAVKGLGGMTFTSGAAGGARPTPNPALARPA